MGFLRDITNALALCERESAQLRDTFNGIIVDDSISETLEPRTVLLVESPDQDEICHGHPLAGDSGKSVTGKLLTGSQHSNVPIGCFLHRGCRCAQVDIQDAAINSLGLMNVSRLPLDSNAYCLNVRQQYSELLRYFQAIKDRPDVSLLSDHAPSRVYKAIRDHLGRRLRDLSPNVLVVPCGKVARTFLCRATCMPGYQGGSEVYASDNDIPHPSRNIWSQRRHRESINNLLETIRSRANDN